VIDEDVLRALVAEAAESFPPPREPLPQLTEGRAEPPRRRARPFVLGTVAAGLVVLLGLVGLTVADRLRDGSARTVQNASGDAGDGLTSEPTAGGGTATGVPAPGDAAGGAGGGGDGGQVAPPLQATKVVKTGAVEVAVGEGAVDDSVTRLTSLAVGSGGFVAESRTFEQGERPAADITIRVPGAAFEQVLGEVRGLGETQSVTTAGQDVTAEYVDLEARLRVLRGTRDQLLGLLSRATTIPDILAVQDRLNATQTEIERLEGQQRVLDDKVALGTLKVTVTEDRSALNTAAAKPRSGLAKAWDDAVDGFTSGVEGIVAASGRILLVVLVLAALTAMALGGWKVLRRRLL